MESRVHRKPSIPEIIVPLVALFVASGVLLAAGFSLAIALAFRA